MKYQQTQFSSNHKTKDNTSFKDTSFQGEGSAKRKLFIRKPAANNISCNISKVRTKLNETSNQINLTSSKSNMSLNVSVLETPNKINLVDRKQRQTQFFNRNIKLDSNTDYDNNLQTKSIFYSPKNIKIFDFDNAKTMENFHFKNKNSKIKKEQTRQIDLSKEYAKINQEITKEQTVQKVQNNMNVTPISFRQRTNTSYIPGLNNISFMSRKSIERLTTSPKNQREKDERPRLNVSFQRAQQLQADQCKYCKNNKQMTHLLSQKCGRLEQKIKEKDKKIKELMENISSLQITNKKLNNDYHNIFTLKQQKQREIYSQREQFHEQIQKLKGQLSQTYEKLRYSDMENNVLLRYKDQYNLITKEFDMKHQQNEQLKKVIAHNRYNGYGNVAFNKNNYRNSNEIKEVKINGNYYPQSSGNLPNTYVQAQVNQKNNQINNNFNLKNQNNQGQNVSKYIEDDLISLNLSQRSLEYI